MEQIKKKTLCIYKWGFISDNGSCDILISQGFFLWIAKITHSCRIQLLTSVSALYWDRGSFLSHQSLGAAEDVDGNLYLPCEDHLAGPLLWGDKWASLLGSVGESLPSFLSLSARLLLKTSAKRCRELSAGGGAGGGGSSAKMGDDTD